MFRARLPGGYLRIGGGDPLFRGYIDKRIKIGYYKYQWRIKMDTYKTKYFGDFTIDEANKNGHYDIVFKGQKMYISLKDTEVGSSQLCGDYLKKSIWNA
jgi:hypothetical protein